MLALFCYRRSHLHSLALAIAASCTERELIQLGGRVGSTLYALSREPAARSTPSSSYGNRKPITLSTKPLSTFAPIEEISTTKISSKPSRLKFIVVPAKAGTHNHQLKLFCSVCHVALSIDHAVWVPAFAGTTLSPAPQPMPLPRHRAFGIAGHAGPAYLGPHRIDRACRRLADLARQRRTAVAVAAHSR